MSANTPASPQSQRILPKEKTVYVIGHRNPDTDSVVSAYAYAALKSALGLRNCRPARAGKTTPQTDYIFNRFNTPLPEFLPDLVPKVDYFDSHGAHTIGANVSLWEAMAVMRQHDGQALAVVDEQGCFHSLLHYGSIAERLQHINNPNQKTAVQTSIDLIASTLHAQRITTHNSLEIRKSPIMVAASEFNTFVDYMKSTVAANTIVICGNRKDVQRHAVRSNVRLLIVTNGNVLDREIREEAEARGVSVLSSPYDTSSTTLQIIYSTPVVSISSQDLRPVNRNDPIKKITPYLSDAPGKSLPVVNDAGKVVGVITESDLYREPNIEVILVDHNEFSQAIEGIENYRVLEIVDHHRLGVAPTRAPITFINKPVGATCTIVAQMFQEYRVPMSMNLVSLLLAGIICDTLILKSATTTQADRDMAEYLSNIANFDIEKFGKEIFLAASRVSGRSAAELISQDAKEYEEQGVKFLVCQIEVETPQEVLRRKGELLSALEEKRVKQGYLFAALLVTDITVLSSLMFLAAEPKFLPCVTMNQVAESVYEMRGIVSRKKQLMPMLSEMIEKYHGL